MIAGVNHASTTASVAIDWTRIEAVLFDMDGTLLDLHFDNHFWLEHLPKRYGEIHQLSTEAAKAALYPRFVAKRGTLDWYCVDFWSRELGVDIEALKKEETVRIALRPHAIDLLQWLGRQGKRRILATNAHRKSLELKLAHTTLGEHFELMVSSHDYGHAKEHDGFWSALARKCHLQLDRCLFIDDSLDVLRAAVRNGVGQVLAIPNPDSTAASKDTAEFVAVADFRVLMQPAPHVQEQTA